MDWLSAPEEFWGLASVIVQRGNIRSGEDIVMKRLPDYVGCVFKPKELDTIGIAGGTNSLRIGDANCPVDGMKQDVELGL
jgi:hypothetical protein